MHVDRDRPFGLQLVLDRPARPLIVGTCNAMKGVVAPASENVKAQDRGGVVDLTLSPALQIVGNRYSP
jgi:hypothetical protein